MRSLSGIQPSGVLHIGNYFGMMQPAIALQATGEAFYFIADYHALTTIDNPETLRANSRRVALEFLACGFDPSRGALFLGAFVLALWTLLDHRPGRTLIVDPEQRRLQPYLVGMVAAYAVGSGGAASS